MTKVNLLPNSETGMIIQECKNSEEFYVIVESKELFERNGFIHSKKRRAMVRGEYDIIKSFAEHVLLGKLEGTIVVHEYLESNLPEVLIPEKEKYVKRNNRKIFVKNGERIFRHTFWCPLKSAKDVYIKHDMLVSVKMKNLME
jgi:hypothetical protein